MHMYSTMVSDSFIAERILSCRREIESRYHFINGTNRPETVDRTLFHPYLSLPAFRCRLGGPAS